MSEQPSMKVLLESILADASAYQWHTAIHNTLALQPAALPAPPQPTHEPLREFAEECEKLPDQLTRMLRHNGYVFERFPRNMMEQPPAGDGERWEALAFSLYSRLAEIASGAVYALNEADELRAASTPPVSQEP